MKSTMLIFRSIFTITCVIGVFLMVGYWIYKFVIEDRDLGVVDYELLEKATVDYPIPSICFKNPFLAKKLKEINSSYDNTKYIKYLKGENSSDQFGFIDYHNYTIDMKEYLAGVEVKLANESTTRLLKNGFWQKTIFNGIIENGHFVKCFELGVEKEKYPDLQQAVYHFHTFKLLNDLGRTQGQKQDIFLNLHYTGQYLLQPNSNIQTKIIYGMNTPTLVYIKSIEFLRRRKNRNHDCLLDGKVYDQTVLTKHIKSHGCSAPYHLPLDGFPVCDNQTELKNYLYDYHIVRRKHSKACQRLSNLNFQSQSYTKGYHWLLFVMYPEEIKIVQQYKEVDGHVLIGNIGGYIGLFLGKKF